MQLCLDFALNLEETHGDSMILAKTTFQLHQKSLTQNYFMRKGQRLRSMYDN